MGAKRTTKKKSSTSKGRASKGKKATRKTPQPKADGGEAQGEFATGDRVRVVKGRKSLGAVGVVFWVGPSKWGEGMRYGVRDDDGEAHWVEEDRLAAADEKAVAAPDPVNEPPSDAVDQVALFRDANPRLLRSPVFGELRWLRDGETPPLVADTADKAIHRIVAWFAVEADGGVLGRLVLDGVPRALWPLVYLSNEGEAELIAFSLVDHLGAIGELDGDGERIQPLLRFCRKHRLPAPRPFPKDLPKQLGITPQGLRKGRIPKKVPLAKLEERAAAAPASNQKPKGPTVGEAVPPLAIDVRCLSDGDGLALVLASKGERSVKARVHRWTGTEFVLDGELPTTVVNLHEGKLAYCDRSHVVVKEGKKTVLRLPHSFSHGFMAQVALRGESLFVYDAADGKLYRREGKVLVEVKGNAGEGGTLLFLDDRHVAVLGQHKGKSLVVDVETGKVSRWPSGKASSVVHMGAYVAAITSLGTGTGITRLDLQTKTWSKPKKAQGIQTLCPLRNGDAVGCADNGNVFVLSREKFTLRKVGKLSLKRTHTARAVEVAPHEVVFVGGAMRTTWQPLEPEIIHLETGETRALPGRSEALRRQARR